MTHTIFTHIDGKPVKQLWRGPCLLPANMQPIVFDDNNIPRFKSNALVRLFYEEFKRNGRSINDLDLSEHPQDEIDQFFQMLGYSVGGYCELAEMKISSPKSADEAVKEVKRLGFPWQQGVEAIGEWKKENGYEAQS